LINLLSLTDYLPMWCTGGR